MSNQAHQPASSPSASISPSEGEGVETDASRVESRPVPATGNVDVGSDAISSSPVAAPPRPNRSPSRPSSAVPSSAVPSSVVPSAVQSSAVQSSVSAAQNEPSSPEAGVHTSRHSGLRPASSEVSQALTPDPLAVQGAASPEPGSSSDSDSGPALRASVPMEVGGEALSTDESGAVDDSTVRPPAVGVAASGFESAAAEQARLDQEKLDQAMMDGATIQLPARPWVDAVPEPVTPVGAGLGAEFDYTSSSGSASQSVAVVEMPAAQALQGRVLANRYLVEALLAEGPAGVVCRADHLGLDRPVVLHVLPRGLAESEQQCAEVTQVATAVHRACPEHVLECLDFGILNDGWPYFVSGKLDGQPLSSLLQAEGKFVLRRVLHIGQQLAMGLAASHNLGLVHGHLHSDFVQITKPGTPAEVVRLGGFGLLSARAAGDREALAPRRNLFGTPFYLSPEQAASRPADVRSDVYSFGILLFEMMTGARPFFDGDFDDILCQHLDDEPAAPSDQMSSPGALAKALDSVILRCLRKEPDQRYQSVADLAQDLKRLEAAASRSRRRPMQEIAKPQSTIHTPMRRSDEPLAPGAKVIVGAQPPKEESSGTASAPRRNPSDTIRPRKVSRFQETVRLSAKDVERAIARRRGGLPRLMVEVRVAWENVSGWVGRSLQRGDDPQTGAPQPKALPEVASASRPPKSDNR